MAVYYNHNFDHHVFDYINDYEEEIPFTCRFCGYSDCILECAESFNDL